MHDPTEPTDESDIPDDGDPLPRPLAVAVSRGVITDQQAHTLVDIAAEQGEEAEAAGRSRRSLVAEAVGDVGGALAAVAALLLVSRLWPDLRPWARVTLPALTSLGLLGGGFLSTADDGPGDRLRGLLWALSALAAGTTVAIALVELTDVGEAAVGLGGGLTTAGYGLLLWRLRVAGLQQVVTFGGLAVSVGAGISLVDFGADWPFGLSVWALGAVWAVLAWSGWLQPERVGLILGATAALIGPFLTDFGPGRVPWLGLLGLATAAVLVAASIPTDRTLLLGLGIAGVFVYVFRLVLEQFGDTLGVPGGLLVAGLLLVAVAVLLAQRRTAEPDGG